MFTLIVRRNDGTEVALRPGGSAERQLIDEIKLAAKPHGIGFFRREKRVLAAIEKAVETAFFNLKSDVLP